MSALLTELQKLIDAAVERRVREELAEVIGARGVGKKEAFTNGFNVSDLALYV